jgi:glycosyltransferase involved in cell wall biosynthesis
LKECNHRAYAAKDLAARDAAMGSVLDGQGDGHATRTRLRKDDVQESRGVRGACIVIPAFDAEAMIGGVIDSLKATLPDREIFVVDDGSRDGTARIAREKGCTVLAHEVNRGKGAALRTAFAAAKERGFDVALTVDADGQHPAEEAKRVLETDDDPDALVLGVRALTRDGAPRKNVFSNGISNFFISRFAGRALADTQCGLRRYPVAKTLALNARGTGYELEAEVLLRAVWAGVRVVEVPIRVLYPEDRVTHFRIGRDPWRIIKAVVGASFEHARGDA